QVGEAFGDPRCAKDLRERVGLLVSEPEHLLRLVWIVLGIDDDFEVTGAPGDNADTVAISILELESQSHAGQQNLFDIHGVHTSGSSIELCANFGRFVYNRSKFGRCPSRRSEDVAEPVAPAR